MRTQTQVMNAAKALINTAPEPIRGKYSKLSGGKLMDALRRKRTATGDGACDALMLSLSALAATWADAESRAAELESLIGRMVRESAPAMLEIDGCGALSAVELGLAAGDNPGRMRSEAEVCQDFGHYAARYFSFSNIASILPWNSAMRSAGCL